MSISSARRSQDADSVAREVARSSFPNYELLLDRTGNGATLSPSLRSAISRDNGPAVPARRSQLARMRPAALHLLAAWCRPVFASAPGQSHHRRRRARCCLRSTGRRDADPQFADERPALVPTTRRGSDDAPGMRLTLGVARRTPRHRPFSAASWTVRCSRPRHCTVPAPTSRATPRC